MRKLIVILALTLTSYISLAQATVKGTITTVYKKKITESGEHVVYDSSYPINTTLVLTDSYLSVHNMEKGFRYELSEKEVSTFEGNYVISYVARRGDKLRLVAARELNCPDYIVVAILPYLDGESRYVEYLVKVRQIKITK